MLKKSLLLFIISISITVIILSATHFSLEHSQFIETLSEKLQFSANSFACWRYSLFMLLILNWKNIVTKLHHHIQLSPEATEYLISKRWHALCFIALFEVLLAHQGLAILMTAIFHAM